MQSNNVNIGLYRGNGRDISDDRAAKETFAISDVKV